MHTRALPSLREEMYCLDSRPNWHTFENGNTVYGAWKIWVIALPLRNHFPFPTLSHSDCLKIGGEIAINGMDVIID